MQWYLQQNISHMNQKTVRGNLSLPFHKAEIIGQFGPSVDCSQFMLCKIQSKPESKIP